MESLFNVKVSGVNTLVMPGKLKRRRLRLYRTPTWKKAVVTLQDGYSIDLI